jgi:preprotein translocase subunit SecA
MVYKEKAFDKFMDLLWQIEFTVVKSIFAINVNTQIKVSRVDDSKLQVQSTDVENMKIWDGVKNEAPQAAKPAAQWNPLFAQPQEQKWFRKPSTKKNKIRV